MNPCVEGEFPPGADVACFRVLCAKEGAIRRAGRKRGDGGTKACKCHTTQVTLHIGYFTHAHTHTHTNTTQVTLHMGYFTRTHKRQDSREQSLMDEFTELKEGVYHCEVKVKRHRKEREEILITGKLKICKDGKAGSFPLWDMYQNSICFAFIIAVCWARHSCVTQTSQVRISVG